eukprot:gene6139-5987_t
MGDMEAQVYVVAPVTRTGWAFLGEWGKVVPVSPQRVSLVAEAGGCLEVHATGIQ